MRYPGDKVEAIASLKVNFGAPDLGEIIYIDHYGNAVTGLRKGSIDHTKHIKIAGNSLAFVEKFSDVKKGTAFWYENSMGLIEIAVNQQSAEKQLALKIGDIVTI